MPNATVDSQASLLLLTVSRHLSFAKARQSVVCCRICAADSEVTTYEMILCNVELLCLSGDGSGDGDYSL